jgi:type IX secretion system PorP/SprF family membrane protein
MKKTFTILLFILFLGYAGYSQQEPQFSQYMLDNLTFNPAVAGMNDAICANLIHRQQWVGFEGRPITTVLSGDLPVRFLHGGLGLNVVQDNIGQFKNLDVKFEYAYHRTVGPGKLALGAQIGFLNTKVDFSKFHPLDSSDPILSSQSTESSFSLDFGFGAFYQIKDKLYGGLSFSQLAESTEKLGNASVKLVRHYYLTGGYHISLDNQGLPGFEVIPSALIKTDGVAIQFDINAMLQYNNKFWAGLSYRKTDAVVIMLGLKPFGPGMYENLKIGYSYDLITSAIGSAGGSWGSHEIYVGYCFKIETQKPQESYKNVRFL